MVAHFDYYYNRGDDTIHGSRGVVLIPRVSCGTSKMNNEDTTAGGYAGSLANQTTCPAIANALSTVFGSYLLSNRCLFSTAIHTTYDSMAGAGFTGAANNWSWAASQTQCVLPNEVQIYGATVFSSSFYDIGEACEKLVVFNFINHVEYGRYTFWLRTIANNSSFAYASNFGHASHGAPSYNTYLRPLIYIG